MPNVNDYFEYSELYRCYHQARNVTAVVEFQIVACTFVTLGFKYHYVVKSSTSSYLDLHMISLLL